MKDFIEYAARLLAQEPDQVAVTETIDGSTVTYELSVAAEDVGRIIGREGRVIRSIRGLVRAAGARQGLRVSLQVH